MHKGRSFLALGALLLVIGACGRDEGGGPLPPSQPPIDAEVPNKPQHNCYLGANRQYKTCVETLDIKNIDDPRNDYRYRNPFTDPTFPEGLDPAVYTAPERLIDLHTLSHQTQLAPDFVLSEFMSSTKGRYGLFSLPTLVKIQAMRDAAKVPFIINSAYRSPGYNAQVDGSASWSRHTFGDAIDFFSPNLSLKKLKDLCLAHGASFFQIYTSHVHCDWRNSARDTHFFPTPVDGPKRLAVAKALAEHLHIDFNHENGVGYADVNHPAAEDAGELIYTWKLTLPNGQVQSFKTRHISFPLSQRGKYGLRVNVGGSLEKTIHWYY